MTPETKNSLAQLANAITDLNKALQIELVEMQRTGMSASKIEHVRAGVKAIKDCGNMLLVWSDYIARGDLADPSEDIETRPDPFPR